MNIRQAIKSGISKFFSYTNINKSSNITQYKENIAYFIALAYFRKSYRESLISTHESEEIEEQMMYADDMLRNKAKVMMKDLSTNCIWIDRYDYKDIERDFIAAIEYNLNYTKDFDASYYFDIYLTVYKKIEKLPEFYLKAVIYNNEKLIKVLSKYYKA